MITKEQVEEFNRQEAEKENSITMQCKEELEAVLHKYSRTLGIEYVQKDKFNPSIAQVVLVKV
jgi:hypothetical protein